MNSTKAFKGQRAPETERFRRWAGQATGLVVILIFSATAYAQYGGGGGTVGSMGTPTTSGTYTPGSSTSYGKGKAIGIGVGAAAAGAGAIYFMTHRSSTVTGCTEMADDGLRLTDDKTKKTLSILPGPTVVNPGERVELKGKIKKSAGGNQNFVVKKVAKDFGDCRSSAPQSK